MLSLQSSRWAELRHAYGSAADIPPLLRQLYEQPARAHDTEPWLTLWSALAYQGNVYSASFAAVPHIVEVLASAPLQAEFSYFQFPAWVEICRVNEGVEIPDDLRSAYFEALARLPFLAAAASSRSWDADFLVSALAAIAAAKGQPKIAEAVCELSSDDAAEKFLDWLFSQ